MIPKHLERRFPPVLRQRGEAYFAKGRVSLLPSERARVVRAHVRGTERYDVTIETDARDKHWAFTCDCPFAEDNRVCKHMWAVLLEADEHGTLPGSNAAPDLAAPAPEPVPTWKRRLSAAKRNALPALEQPEPWPANRRIVYHLDLDSVRNTGQIVIDVKAEWVRDAPRSAQAFDFSNEAWLTAPEASDRQIAHLLLGAQLEHSFGLGHTRVRRFVIPVAMYETTLRAICDTGRCVVRASDLRSESQPIAWDEGPPWALRLRLARHGKAWRLEGSLMRAKEERPLESALLLTAHGLAVFPNTIARFAAAHSWTLIPLLHDAEPLSIPDDQVFDFVAEVMQLPQAPAIELPPELSFEEKSPAFVPRLIVKPAADFRLAFELEAELGFDYDGHVIAHGKRGAAIILRKERCILHRQPEREQEAANRLRDLGLRERLDWRSNKDRFVFAPRQLPAIVETLTGEGWHVEADGKRYRTASSTDVSVSSGIDWFELNGSAQFGDQRAQLPQLLSALRKGERTVVLDDGTLGLLPVQWLQRFAGVADMGSAAHDGDSIRFTRAQSTLLDALLATLPEPRVDETFQHIRDELRDFAAVAPADPAPSFTGELRHYQREGLGWMGFLRRFGLGGCLADDMGLGKTVQVLALLDERRAQQAGPALVVVPKSLVFNWTEEAARFAPQLRVRDYTGGQRRQDALHAADFDVLLTTYGTLRRDAPTLREIEFDYIILDEAQAIKNAKTASAKAARLLRGRNRLALSGTPIENRLEELWSLFDFLNPGMLGASSAFAALKKSGRGNGDDGGGRALLARALRPFLLRRTKEQVAPELPARLEQTLIVELEPAQRALYDELRDHYRQSLLQRIDRIGIKRAKIEILEALLRLRQAACHAGLIDPKRNGESSSKLDVLSAQLSEIVAEGHKALVFSQFTSFLALVRKRLDADGLVYEYLDGKTRDRQQRVQRFQTDADCPLFLISLRAGGYGLNLTAADYVFVLDPWWNPAVEAQAIDRTHRIGQQRPVFALRLIARDTVEEKVLELQRHKRELADAILGADASVLAAIGREELELLLG